MARRSTRLAAVPGLTVVKKATSRIKKPIKKPTKKPATKVVVDCPPGEVNHPSQPYPSPSVESRSDEEADAAMATAAPDDYDASAVGIVGKSIQKETPTAVTTVPNNRGRRNLRAARQNPTKYVEEDSSTDEDNGCSSEDVEDDDRNDSKIKTQSKKRPRQQKVASNNTHRKAPKGTASSTASRKPLKELIIINKNRTISGMCLSVREGISKKWEPNKGGDWRDPCALDY